MAMCSPEKIYEEYMPVVAHLKIEECCGLVCKKSKESIVVGCANTPANTVVESDCGSVNTTDHKGDAPTRCVVEPTHVTELAELVDRCVGTPSLDAGESAGDSVQRTTPHYGL
ncbi:hypothetical protein Plhal304r1_c113g0176591 [Plasmopara halstedii]